MTSQAKATTAAADLWGRDLSIVVPVYNEVDNLRALVEEITRALAPLGLDYEIILIDDGSDDGSFPVLQALHEEYRPVTAIRFRRNYGQTAAFAAGFAAARGAVVVTLDADGQNDPADIPALLAHLQPDTDVVNGWRRRRQDNPVFRRLPSYLANQIITRASGVRLRDRGCSLRAFRAEVTRSLRLYGELHRFIPELAASQGFTLAEVPVNHRPRRAGRSKYGLSRTFRVLLDLSTVLFLDRYADRPMHIFGGIGIASGLLGFVICSYLAAIKIWAGIQGGLDAFRQTRIGDRPLLLLGILLLTVGVQFLVMGLLAELMVRTYYESQNKAVYHVRQVLRRESGGENTSGS